MLELVQNAKTIENAWKRFHDCFVNASERSEIATVGFPGGSVTDTVYQFLALGFWYCQGLPSLPRFWNGFGSENPRNGAAIPIDVEINFPKAGIDRTVAGAFAVDPRSGHLWVVHRGKIGGGRKGVSKRAFWDLFRSESVWVLDGDRETRVALVAAIDSPRFVAQIGSFVGEVKRIKRAATSAVPGQHILDDHGEGKDIFAAFTEEFSGSKKYPTRDELIAKCDHGLVVNELASQLELAGFKVANDRHRDLFMVGAQGRVTVLFEVKVARSPTTIHQAVGQLMLHGRAVDNATRLVLVIPEGADEKLERRLGNLQLHVVQYSWRGDKPYFYDLSKVSRLAQREK